MQKKLASLYTGYDIIVVLVGANNLGRLNVNGAVNDLHELLLILQEANPKADIYACEVYLLLENENIILLIFQIRGHP